jgi:hypothetical protein
MGKRKGQGVKVSRYRGEKRKDRAEGLEVRTEDLEVKSEE